MIDKNPIRADDTANGYLPLNDLFTLHKHSETQSEVPTQAASAGRAPCSRGRRGDDSGPDPGRHRGGVGAGFRPAQSGAGNWKSEKLTSRPATRPTRISGFQVFTRTAAAPEILPNEPGRGGGCPEHARARSFKV